MTERSTSVKILFATKAMSNPGGGAERVLASVASGLSRRGHDVLVLTYDRGNSLSYYSLDPNISFLRLGIGSASRPTNLIETLRRVTALRSKLTELRPDVVIGFNASMFVPLWLSLIGLRIPLIASEHSSYGHYRSRPRQALLLRLAPFFTNKITVLSEQVLRTFPGSLQSRMVVVNNPVLGPNHLRANVSETGNRNVLLAVGRLSAEKDHGTLIEAFSPLAPLLPNWDLRIVGDGELRAELEEKITEERLVGRVSMPGSVKDISLEYLNAQILVMPSKYEGFGLVVAEALAHGLPVVGFADCDGINALIKSGVNGVLVQSGENRVSALSQALRKLMLSSGAREKLARNCEMPPGFEVEQVVDMWEELIGKVAAA